MVLVHAFGGSNPSTPAKKKEGLSDLLFSCRVVVIRTPGFAKQNIAGFGAVSEAKESALAFSFANKRRSELARDIPVTRIVGVKRAGGWLARCCVGMRGLFQESRIILYTQEKENIIVTSRRIAYDEYVRNRLRRSLKFSDAEIILVKKYLKNPTNAGLWRLEARWLFNHSPIAKEIDDIITKEAPKLKFNKRRISVDEREMESLLARTESISFYLRLFTRLVRLKDDQETLSEYIDEDDDDRIIISLLDLEKLSIRYSTAISYFEKNIYTADNDFKVGGSNLTRLKDGSFMCGIGPRKLEGSRAFRRGDYHFRQGLELKFGKKKIELTSLSHEPLEKLGIFFQKLKLIDEIDQFAMFSPEEEVLAPYVDILQKVISDVLQRKSDGQFFNKMISDYRDGNYTGCISTAGLIVEDCLTQIYETIYRKPVPRKMTLGSLQQKIGEVTRDKNSQELERQSVARLLKQYKDNNKSDPVRLADINGKLLLRYIDERYKKLDTRVDYVEGKTRNDDFFPAIIKMNLEDIIRFRNAASHKSLDPVGSFEALKSIYCSFSLMTWWDEEKRKIDWTQDQEEIIKQFIIAAKAA